MVSSESFRNPQHKHGFRTRIFQKACESFRILCESSCESSGLLTTATSFSGTRWSNIDADPERIAANPLNFSPQHPRFLVQAGNPREKTILSFKCKLHVRLWLHCFLFFLALSRSDLGYIRLFCYTEAIFTCEGGHPSCQAPKHEAYRETPCTSRAHRTPC